MSKISIVNPAVILKTMEEPSGGINGNILVKRERLRDVILQKICGFKVWVGGIILHCFLLLTKCCVVGLIKNCRSLIVNSKK